jgi:hypothetical protein
MPAPAPPLGDNSQLWELLYESLGFHVDDDATGDLQRFCEAWCAPAQPMYDVAREREDGTPPWSVLFDPDLCPANALPYLAQYVGIVITPEMSEAQIRNEIKQPTGWRRGQTESIRIAARRTLVPVEDEELFVIIRPRTPEVGRHYVRTLVAQTPTPVRTEAVIRAALPAWEVLDYAAISGESFTDLTASKYTTFGAVAAAFPTFQDLTETLPGDL